VFSYQEYAILTPNIQKEYQMIDTNNESTTSEQKSSSEDTRVDPAPKKEETGLVTYQDFSKVHLRVGVIEGAEKIEKSEKLLKLQVNMGATLGIKQIIAGIAKHYEPENLLQKRIIVVSNLSPAKLMGHVSEGMLLAASNEEGNLELVSVSDTFEAGSVVR
jgi:methionyl-tRNA synthetase